ncbi:MAG: hypothetical protein ACI4TM_09280 [Candidatus Cryptobacteroides sp.]
MIRICIILYSFLLIPSGPTFASPERTYYLVEKDWDKILDRYESLCNECIELKIRAEAGEKISGNSVSRLIGILSSLKKELKDGAGQMSDTQKQRFEGIKSHYSEFFGNRQGVRQEVPKRKNEQVAEENGKRQVHERKSIQKEAKTQVVVNEIKEPAVMSREKEELPETHIYQNLTFRNAYFLKQEESSLVIAFPKPAEAISAQEGNTRALRWTIAASASFFPVFSYGVMLSIASNSTGWGGYVKFQSNFHKTSSTYECLSDGSFNGGKLWPSGNSSVSKTKASAGGRKLFGKHFGVYAGAGYGYQAIYWEDISGKWASVSDLCVGGVLAECGALLDFGPIELSLGVSTTAFRCTDMEISIGFRF